MSESESDIEKEIRSRGDNLKTQVVVELKYFFNEKFESLKWDIHEDSEWKTETVIKKVRADNFVSLKSTANKKHFQFNTEVIDILNASKRAIDLRNA